MSPNKTMQSSQIESNQTKIDSILTIKFNNDDNMFKAFAGPATPQSTGAVLTSSPKPAFCGAYFLQAVTKIPTDTKLRAGIGTRCWVYR